MMYGELAEQNASSLFFMLFSGLHIMIVKRKRMENRKYLVARSPFVK